VSESASEANLWVPDTTESALTDAKKFGQGRQEIEQNQALARVRANSVLICCRHLSDFLRTTSADSVVTNNVQFSFALSPSRVTCTIALRYYW
jgi:hypothetical protein